MKRIIAGLIILLSLLVGGVAWANISETEPALRIQSCTMTYDMVKATPKALQQAINDIYKVSGIAITRVPRGQGQIHITRRYKIDSYAVAEAHPFTVWNSDGSDPYISGGTIDVYSPMVFLPFSYRRMVYEHELGHILGLPHSPNPKEVMYYKARGWRKTPEFVAALRALYPECLPTT